MKKKSQVLRLSVDSSNVSEMSGWFAQAEN